ncbi:porin OmpC [Enterobacteriaceae bacterium H11S18]|uniref:porin OmpC n=1 Tax=Dryocola clanedunensis TaxID=2925396 RepID=UPI0022F05E04|nr:porin OmpC [Dryocola clanedunensis]MCT4706667.1 porin OmpC [Dryocola clanedunensis]MCT4712194.1 porin OmpC [Dryocola clanedunensis]
MKRTALALIIPAILTMGAANAAEIYNKDGNKLDLYGKVDARHTFSDNKGDDGDGTYAQVGFKGETQITSELTGYGQWEYKMMANNVEGSDKQAWTRLAYAGLQFGDYGSFDYGRNYGVVYDIDAWTDMLPVFGGDTAAATDNFMMGRTNGVATYRNSDFFGLVEGLNFAVQYQGNNESGPHEDEDGNLIDVQEGTNNGRSVGYQNGDGWGISSSYDFGGYGFSAGAAYASSDRTNEQRRYTTAGGDKADAWTVGLKYDANNIYLATMYAETRNMTRFGGSDAFVANKTQNFEVVAQYQFDFGLRPSVAYLQSKGKELNSAYGNDKDLVKYVDVATYYYFNKNFSAYADYKINLLDDNSDFYSAAGISTDDVVGIGMIYQF